MHPKELTGCTPQSLQDAPHRVYRMHPTELTGCTLQSLQDSSHRAYRMHPTEFTGCTLQSLQDAPYRAYRMHPTEPTQVCITRARTGGQDPPSPVHAVGAWPLNHRGHGCWKDDGQESKAVSASHRAYRMTNLRSAKHITHHFFLRERRGTNSL